MPKSYNSNTKFLAETLGCTLNQCEETAKAGFDYILSSSKWWDFTNPWALEQYNEYRVYAPSISFPESHDTPRLAYQSNNRMDYQIFRYLFAAFFSAGVLMPIGYEYGFNKKLDVVDMEPADWEQPHFNISRQIGQINHFKQKFHCLNEDGPLFQFEHNDLNVLVLRKTSLDESQQLLMVYNKNWNEKSHIYFADLNYYLTLGTNFYQISFDHDPTVVSSPTVDQDLSPNGFLLFLQEKSVLGRCN